MSHKKEYNSDGIVFNSRKDNRIVAKADLKNRGVSDIFIACHDNLTGLSDAINAVFPKTRNQLCIIHQIRNSCKFVPYKDRKAICADLKKIYGAINLDDAEFAKEKFREKWDRKYPNILKSWDRNWAELTLFLSILLRLERSFTPRMRSKDIIGWYENSPNPRLFSPLTIRSARLFI